MGSHLSDVWFRTTDLEVVSGSGCVVRTADGTEYLDFTAGIAVASTGHSHPRVVDAIREQAGQIMHAQANCYRSPLPEQLATALGADHAAEHRHVLLHQLGRRSHRSGGEAGAPRDRPPERDRRAGRLPRPHVPHDGDDHLEGRRARRLPAAARRASSRRRSRARSRGGVDEATAVDARARRPSLAARTRRPRPSETAAFVMEPVLGEGGYLPAPIAFVRGVAEICAEHGILFVADEVQTGFARTGRMFAVEHSGGGARHHGDGEGHRVGLPDRGDRRPRRADGALAAAARTAAPTARTRWAARPRSRRST